MTANEKGRDRLATGATLGKHDNDRPDYTLEFRRDRLPDPVTYYTAQQVRLTGRGAWRDALCPFHEDSKPSLRVNVERGAFKCMACGAHGGGVLDFHMQRHGLRFVDAAKALGAWEESR